MTAYRILDENAVASYVREQGLLDGDLRVEEVGDGNVNLVFVVRSDGGSVVVKQALPYLRVAGEGWPLTRDRMLFEIAALETYNGLVPGLVPALIHADPELSLVVMEHLADHAIMRRPLVAGQRFPHFADHISTFLARTLFLTSDLHLSGIEKKALQKRFINPHLCALQEAFVYTNPFTESEENQHNPLLDAEVARIRGDAELKLGVLEMKHAYMTNAESLIHGDLHTGSIMLNAADTRVIDPEFAFYGPMAYDVAAVLQNLVLNYLSHEAHTVDEAYREWLLALIVDIWNRFVEKFLALWPSDPWLPEAAWDEVRRRRIQHILRGVAGHGGTKFLRRMMGIVSVWDVTSIEDLEARASVERKAMAIGRAWVLERNNVTRIEDLVRLVRDPPAF